VARVVSWRKLRFRFDWMLTVATLVCISLDCSTCGAPCASASSPVAQQLSWAAVGGLLFWRWPASTTG